MSKATISRTAVTTSGGGIFLHARAIAQRKGARNEKCNIIDARSHLNGIPESKNSDIIHTRIDTVNVQQ
jgi:hypothetical protein